MILSKIFMSTLLVSFLFVSAEGFSAQSSSAHLSPASKAGGTYCKEPDPAGLPTNSLRSESKPSRQPIEGAPKNAPSIAKTLESGRSVSDEISLVGRWEFRLDPHGRGIAEKWFSKVLPDTIHLPGSCGEQGYGIKTSKPYSIDRLTRVYKYEGPAWYQRVIYVPASWKGKELELFLERCHWETKVWLDNKPFGMQNSLSVPHVYELGRVSPGRHVLTIDVDNTYRLAIGRWASALTEDTEGNWNGITGKIELIAKDPVWIKRVEVYPKQLIVSLSNQTGREMKADINCSIVQLHKSESRRIEIARGNSTVDIPFSTKARPWSQFSPVMRKLVVTLRAGHYRDTKNVSYAVRHLGTRYGQFTLNGKPIMLRGTVDECVYPLTGYPPMNKAAWLRVLRTCKSYGFNFMRFHSWCPPEAAFEAGDELGFMFQVELPFWSMGAPPFGQDPPRDKFLRDELKRILTVYGNHPSFALMAMGNESGGPLDELVKFARHLDPRHLYRCENGDTHVNGDYFEIGERGVMGPRTNWNRWSFPGWIAGNDSTRSSRRMTVPTLDHEVGQWAMYPDYSVIKKFRGNYQPYNYIAFRKSLRAHHMLGEDKAFARASGKFSVLLYKEEIEACERTMPYGGFEILDARDYTGQGTATVGWLDPFWDSKGLITPKQFRRFCGPTVCLLEMRNRVFTTADSFKAKAEIANYGPKSLRMSPRWEITDKEGTVIAHGNLKPALIKTGGLTGLGNLDVDLEKFPAPARYTVTLSGAGTSNNWRIWVYPDRPLRIPGDVIIAHSFDQATRAALAAGRRVLLFSSPKQGVIVPPRAFYPPDSLRLLPPVEAGRSALPGSFLPVFWNARLFNQIGTLGIFCNPKNPALADFPTEDHSDWQWADLLGNYSAAESFRVAGAPLKMCDELEKYAGDVTNRAKAIILNGTPANYRPIVQVVDNCGRNAKLGLIFQTRVGKGKLLVCALDLETNQNKRPEARQLEQSLLNYIAGDKFSPKYELPMQLLKKLLLP